MVMARRPISWAGRAIVVRAGSSKEATSVSPNPMSAMSPGTSKHPQRSIVDPAAQIVEGSFIFKMPQGYGDVLTEQEINDLIAFIMTQ